MSPPPRPRRGRIAAAAWLLPLVGPAACSPAPTGSVSPPSATSAAVGALAADPSPSATATGTPTAVTPTATPSAPPPGRLRVAIRPFKEPDDYAHRNYCGAGATEVLLSAWEPSTPDIETVARAAHLDPRSGETGADAVVAINSLLAPIVRPQLGTDRYAGGHATDLGTVLAALRSDLADPVALAHFGHGVPVMLQTMTRSMPGWNHWNATHMITVFAADLSHDDPAVDTVSYAETPSTVAAYSGPPTATITVRALWVAMQQFLVDSPRDPINLIR